MQAICLAKNLHRKQWITLAICNVRNAVNYTYSAHESSIPAVWRSNRPGAEVARNWSVTSDEKEKPKSLGGMSLEITRTRNTRKITFLLAGKFAWVLVGEKAGSDCSGWFRTCITCSGAQRCTVNTRNMIEECFLWCTAIMSFHAQSAALKVLIVRNDKKMLGATPTQAKIDCAVLRCIIIWKCGTGCTCA